LIYVERLCLAKSENKPIMKRRYPSPSGGNPERRTFKKAVLAAGIGTDIGWRTFRHTYRSLLDETGALMKVQQKLMHPASIETTMNVYGQAMPARKRLANSKVVQMVLTPTSPKRRQRKERQASENPSFSAASFGCFLEWGFLGFAGYPSIPRNRLKRLVAGVDLNPSPALILLKLLILQCAKSAQMAKTENLSYTFLTL
jgi:hypothetical protein